MKISRKKVRGRCGHIIEGIYIYDNISEEEIYDSKYLCPNCE